MLNSSSEAVVVIEQETGDQATRSERQENPRVGETGRGQNTRNASRPMVAGWQRQCIQVEMERPAEMVPRAPGEVLMENKVARTYLRRADFEQRGLSEGCPDACT